MCVCVYIHIYKYCFLLIYKHCALPSRRAFFLCAGAWVRACRIAPSQAVVPPTPLSTVNYIWFSLPFFPDFKFKNENLSFGLRETSKSENVLFWLVRRRVGS